MDETGAGSGIGSSPCFEFQIFLLKSLDLPRELVQHILSLLLRCCKDLVLLGVALCQAAKRYDDMCLLMPGTHICETLLNP